jgi:uncharacterized protein
MEQTGTSEARGIKPVRLQTDDGNRHPFAMRFCTADNRYIYDVNTNGFVQVDEVIYDIIDDFGRIPEPEIVAKYAGKYPAARIMQATSEVKRLQQAGELFSAFRPRRLFFPKTIERVTDELNTKMRQLILGVTEQCNLRCRYCVYSGSYQYQRQHASRWMDFGIARKAIDLFGRCSSATENPTVGFYGGEPLLAFDLIRQVAEYVNKNYNNRLRFDMTTNGTLLSGDIARFLVDNNFNLQVSLDGPLPIHDAMRVFPGGEGSFRVVMDNLRTLKSCYPDFFRHNVTFSICLNALDEIERIYDFFREEELFSEKLLSINYVDPRDTDLFARGVVVSTERRPMLNMIKRFVDAVATGRKPDHFLKSLFELLLLEIHQRSIRPLAEDHYPNGICTAGVRRLFCSIDGDLTICERVNPGLTIGHVDTGVDPERVLELANMYAEICSPECRDCWAVRFCSACYRDLYRDRFDLDKKREFCETERKVLSVAISMYCAALEINEHAFDYMGKMTRN